MNLVMGRIATDELRRGLGKNKDFNNFGVSENTTGKGVSPDGSRGKTGGVTPSGGSGDGYEASYPAPSKNPMTSVVGVRQFQSSNLRVRVPSSAQKPNKQNIVNMDDEIMKYTRLNEAGQAEADQIYQRWKAGNRELEDAIDKFMAGRVNIIKEVMEVSDRMEVKNGTVHTQRQFHNNGTESEEVRLLREQNQLLKELLLKK